MFETLRARVLQDPNFLQQIMGQLQTSNPELYEVGFWFISPLGDPGEPSAVYAAAARGRWGRRRRSSPCRPARNYQNHAS